MITTNLADRLWLTHAGAGPWPLLRGYFPDDPEAWGLTGRTAEYDHEPEISAAFCQDTVFDRDMARANERHP